MACFRLVHNGYDAEVMILIYDTEPTLLVHLLVIVTYTLIVTYILYLIITLYINYSYHLYPLY